MEPHRSLALKPSRRVHLISEIALRKFGISSFIAHKDIEPTQDWQHEIEAALATCDAVLALLHPGFHCSNWTNQEIGYATGRRSLIVPVALGTTPYGFIARSQAITGVADNPERLAQRLAEILREHPKRGEEWPKQLSVAA